MNRILPQYSTVTFSDVWDEADKFVDDYNNNGIPTTLSDTQVTTLFFLLFARFGNNPIANRDINQFKMKIFSVIYQYGPTWAKKRDIQDQLTAINFANEDWLQGAKAIYNTALNPETVPSTQSLEELQYINQQNVTNHKRSKFDSFAILTALLEDDITYRFLNKFQHCFKQFVAPEEPLLFVTEEDED